MDRGSSLNILYAKTLDAMGIDRSRIRPTEEPFHGIVPRKAGHATWVDQSAHHLWESDRFRWMPEAMEALDKVKQLLMKAPILVPPTDGEPLLLYITATTQVVSAILVVEREEEGHTLKVQRPVYFISEVLSNSKTRYPQIQKLWYAVLIAKRKLRHYFESHLMMVVTSFPLNEVVQNRDAIGRIVKRALELMG